MSPWDLQPVTERDPGNPDLSAQDTDASGAATSNIPLTDEERLALAYEPDEETEWLGEGREEMTQRLVAGLEALSQLNFAGPFVYPVDVQAYPDYWTVVPYPTDLSTIREKLLNKYYRRVVSLLWEVKQLERNARLYNEEESQIVRNSAKLVSVLNEFIRNFSCNDILSLCEDEEAMDVGDVEVQVENISEESAGEGDTPQDSAVPGSRKRKRGSSSEGPNKQIKREQPPPSPVEPWMQSAHELLDFLVSREDATPFRHPVDLNEFPDYTEIIAEPMDFSTVYRRLEDNLYNDPEAFVRDVRLIFSNSRAYNTLPRSRIYSMTIRLSAMFEDRVDSVLRDWYESASGGARRTRLRTLRLLGSQATGGSGVSRQRMSHSGSQATSSAASSAGVVSSSNSLSTRESRTRSVATRAAITSETDQRNGYGHPVRTETRGSSRANPQSHHYQDNDNVFDDTGVSGRATRSTRSSARRELVMRIPTSRIQQSVQEEGVSNGPLTTRYSTRRSTSLAHSSTSVNEEESEEEEEEEEEQEEGEEGSEEGEEQGDESEEEGGEDEEEDDDEEEEEEESEDSADDSRHHTRRKAARPTHRPTVTLRTTRSANASSARSSRSKTSASASRRTSETSQQNNAAPSRRSLRRNSSVRRVRYNENDSDSESDSAANEVIGVSSRGRVRKPAIRMQDYVE